MSEVLNKMCIAVKEHTNSKKQYAEKLLNELDVVKVRMRWLNAVMSQDGGKELHKMVQEVTRPSTNNNNDSIMITNVCFVLCLGWTNIGALFKNNQA